MEADTLQEAQKREEDRLASIPIMDEDDDLDRGLDILEAAEGQRVVRTAEASAPISMRGRLVLAREMLVRAVAELEAVAAARGVAGSWVITAREHANEGLRWLDKELADEE